MIRCLFATLLVLSMGGAAFAQSNQYQRTIPVRPDGTVIDGGGVGSVAANTAYAPAQITVGTTAVQIIAAGALTNMRVVRTLAANTQPCYLGGAGVTTATGLQIGAGGSYTEDAKVNSAALFAICGAAAQVIAVMGF